jgi:hypothetical protein
MSRNIALTILLFLSALLPQRLVAEVKVELQTRRTYEFKEAGVRFNNDFPGARMNDCTQIDDSHFRIVIKPENFPINNSPWYAFQVVSREKKTVTVTLAYEQGKHRYHPKISHDGANWTMLGANLYRRDREKNEAVLTLSVGPKPIWVSAQEIFATREFGAWMNKMDRASYVKRSVVGESMLHHPMDQLEIGDSEQRNYVFIIGRQHPPEVTGSFALMAFTETIAGNSKLAKDFRRHFRTVVVPLMNPDGVENGHWRHNMGGVDLNRDWNNFAQPETRLVRDHFIKLGKASGARPFLMLDFHSTQEDMFYTQPDSEKTFPENFTANWLAAIQKRFPDYKIRRSASHEPGGVTSKVWGYTQFGIPCITYELGDGTDRKRIKQIASGAAEEMMRLLLEELR